MVKFTWVLAFLVTFVLGMYFNEALHLHRQYQVEYQADRVVGEQQ